MNNTILLSPSELEEFTNGYWIGESKGLTISDFAISQNQIKANCMVIATSPQNWGQQVGNSHNNFNRKLELGTTSFMLEKLFVDSCDLLPDAPILVVKDTNKALRDIAIAIRDKSKAKRVQITGTEGKTGFKHLLDFLVGEQAKCYSQKSSANLTTPILLSLCRLREDTEYTVIEVSCPQPNRCRDRSKIIKPDLCVITNLHISHMNTHGSSD